jgi:serine phosphatase RsbU (regulator of sigma subunit)
MAARYQPSTAGLSVGGDWYDVIDLDGDRVALVVGDVEGHDLEAAAVMGQLRTAIRAFALEGHEAAAVMDRASRYMLAGDFDRLATCCYIELSVGRSEATMVRAGHIPPWLAHGQEVGQLDVGGHLPLGVDIDLYYQANEIVVPPGSTLVLATDGLIERRTRPMEVGIELVQQRLREAEPNDVERLADAIVSGAATADDDVAILLVHKLEGPN